MNVRRAHKSHEIAGNWEQGNARRILKAMNVGQLVQDKKINQWEVDFLNNMKYNICKFRYTVNQYSRIIKISEKIEK